MKRLWVQRTIDAPPDLVWRILTEPAQWPHWGPSVRSAEFSQSRLEQGARGTVTTVVGLRLPFEITDFEEGTRWAWKVMGVAATDHTIEHLSPDRCRVGFGVPWLVAPYLLICLVALGRIDSLAVQ